LSPNEAAEVKAFVKEGGTVIADLRPGVRDEHGKPYEKGGVLDAAFGVKQRSELPKAANCDVKDVADLSIMLKGAACDLSVKLGTGKARALLGREPGFDAPALIINPYGKGKAILLNFSLANYAGVVGSLESSAVKAGDEAGAIRKIFRGLMLEAGVVEPAKLETEIEGVRLYRFGRDKLNYLGVLQELPEAPAVYAEGKARPLAAKPAVIKLAEKKHVYDVRSGKYLGFIDRIETAIEPGKGLLFALLPYEVTGLRMKINQHEDAKAFSESKWKKALRRIKENTGLISAHVVRGGVLEYEIEAWDVKNPGLHVFRTELVSPKGEVISYYSENVVGEKGTGKGSVPLALNDAAGKWKIRARDVATSAFVEKTFMIEE